MFLRVQFETSCAFQAGETDDVQNPEWDPSHVGDGSCQGNVDGGNSGAPSSSKAAPNLKQLASIDSFDSKWFACLHFLLCILFDVRCNFLF